MSKWKAGDIFEDHWDDEVGRIVYANGEWYSDQDRATFEDQYGGMPDEMPSVILYEYMYHDEFIEGEAAIREFIAENGLIDVEERKRLNAERQHIVDALKALNVDTDDLIVSNGTVYIGEAECCDYIQGTHAWCSSSMSC